MNSFLSRLRLRWSLATQSFGAGLDFTDIVYRVYLNHNKIIHFRDGHPVYSLMTPALFTKPAANFIARALYKTIQNRNLPNLLSFAVNDVCDAGCRHCSFYSAVEEPGRSTLSLSQASQAIADSLDLGVSVINFVGGEPLLRDDFPEIVRSVDKSRATTILFTNGSLLEQRIPELRRAGLDSVFVSIDAADPETHDAFRKSPGLHQKALRGIQLAKRLGCSTGFSVTMTPESWKAGELQRIIELAKNVGVHEVFVFDAMPSGRYQERTDLIDDHDWTEEMIQFAVPYNKDPKYPGVTFAAYMSSHRSVGCSCGTSYFYLSPYGDVMSCDFNHAKFGNILEEPLYRIWDRLSTRPEFCHSKWGGCKIKDSEFRQLESVSPVASNTSESCNQTPRTFNIT
ncbi:MAG: radical SAM protein [Planctomycetaceae bacterium]|nr:radical SAM protein [Planctomycetaceae bacterium]